MYLCTFNEKQTCIRCFYAGWDVPAYPIGNTHCEIYILLYIYFQHFYADTLPSRCKEYVGVVVLEFEKHLVYVPLKFD